MTSLERAAAWIAAVGVFAAINPVQGMDPRQWQEIVLIYGGTACALVAMSCGSLALSVLGVWITASAALHPSPQAVGALMVALAWWGLAALAHRTGAGAQIVRVVVALNVGVMLAQAAGLWLPALRLVSPAAERTIHNPLHPWTGLTASTGDVAVVLAAGLPLLLTAGRRWALVAVAALAALLSTQALSGIVAGTVGLLVAIWPQVRSWWARQAEWRVALASLAGLFITGALGCAPARAEIAQALADERWRVWAAALTRWITTAPISGFGLGSWSRAPVTILDSATSQARVWTDLHFDLLQAGYDLGAVGALLIVAAFVVAWRRASWPVRGALAALAVAQFGHFPMRLGSGLVVAALVAGEAMRGDGNREGSAA